MPKSPKPPKSKGNAGVVRRSESRGRRLDPAFEGLARGESKRAQRPPQPRKRRLRDPRPVAMVPGIANRDARLVAGQRIDVIANLVKTSPESEELGLELAETIWLALWRGNSLTSFDALVENVVGMPPKDAHALAQRFAKSIDVPLQTMSDEVIAPWMRMEAELSKHRPELRVRLAGLREDAPQLHMVLPALEAPELLIGLGRFVGVLARDQIEEPEEQKPRFKK